MDPETRAGTHRVLELLYHIHRFHGSHLDHTVLNKVQWLTPYSGGWILTSARHKPCLGVFKDS